MKVLFNQSSHTVELFEKVIAQAVEKLVVVYFQVQFRQFPGKNEGNNENLNRSKFLQHDQPFGKRNDHCLEFTQIRRQTLHPT